MDKKEKARLQSKSYRERAYRKNLELVKTYYGFPFKCSQCDYTSDVFAPFDMHHINANEKEGTPSQLFKTATGKFEIEMRKCILLCANCHRLHHHGSLELKKRESDDVNFHYKVLSDNTKNAIRKLYRETLYSRKELADMFTINELTVFRATSDIKKSIKGKHVGKPSNNRKLKCTTIRKIKEETMKNRTNKSIAIEFGVSEHLVRKIKKEETYHECFASA